MKDRPLYSIGTVSELLDVHPETLRVWERHGLLKPARRKGHRCYTDRCPSLRCTGSRDLHAKPCWRRPNAYCASPMLGSEPCGSCNGKPAPLPKLIEGLAPIDTAAVEEKLVSTLLDQQLRGRSPVIPKSGFNGDTYEQGTPN